MSRNCVCHLRIDEVERADLDRRAAALELSRADYIRQSVFGSKSAMRVPNADLLTQLWSEVRRVGNNLNQLTKLAHSERAIPERNEIIKMYKVILKMRDLLEEAIEGKAR